MTVQEGFDAVDEYFAPIAKGLKNVLICSDPEEIEYEFETVEEDNSMMDYDADSENESVEE